MGSAAYVKETGDRRILDEPVRYRNEPGSETALYEHLGRALGYTLDRLGPHGLPLIGRADWNDCLSLSCFSETPGESFQTTENRTGGVAESVFIERLVHRLTGGRTTASGLLSGLPVIMLTTTGARTGHARTQPVLAFSDGPTLLVIASNHGRGHHPGWYHNLKANPHASVTIGCVTRSVEAREVTGQERDRCIRDAAALYPRFLVYQARSTHRPIPVSGSNRFDQDRSGDAGGDEVEETPQPGAHDPRIGSAVPRSVAG